MSPIMVAASEGNVEITKFLLEKGHLIEKPHHPRCQCEAKCKNKPLEGETLFESISRISAYKGLSSPTYIMLANSDPFLAAFRLSKELIWLAEFFPSHKVRRLRQRHAIDRMVIFHSCLLHISDNIRI